MATKTRPSRVETEIEKCRANANWAKLQDLSKQLPYKSPPQEAFANFIQVEARLERFLLDNPEIGVKSHELSAFQKQLQECTTSAMRSDYREEAQILVAKICYLLGNINGALSRLQVISLDKFSLENSSRSLRLYAEGYAIHGLCLEKDSPSPESSTYQRILHCFERAADLGLLQLQERHEARAKSASTTSTIWTVQENDPNAAGPFIEMAIQKSPVMLTRNGKMWRGIARFRELLHTVQLKGLPGIRQVLARQLAEILLRRVCEKSYQAITDFEPSEPHKPKVYSGSGLYVPKNENEEALLLLLLAESIASREAVLDRSPEHAKTRILCFRNTTIVYDLLTILLVRQGQYQMLSETFERAMKFSFEEFHIWYQLALSLISAGNYSRAVLVLKECIRLNPKNPAIALQAAQICLHNTHQIDDGIACAKLVIGLGDTHLRAKGFVACGIGYSMKAEQARLQKERQDFHRKALNMFLRASALDSNDHLPVFYTALQMAEMRQIKEAMKYVRLALELRSDHCPSLQLLALLLTADNHPLEALALIETAVNEYPSHISLLLLKCKLQQSCHGAELALQTGKHILHVWKNHLAPTVESEQRGTGLLDKALGNQRNARPLPMANFSDGDSNSLRAESLAASHIERTLSEVASSMGSSPHVKQGSQQLWHVQVQIWLQLAELYLELEKLDSAQACIHEAAAIQPVSHIVSHMKGRLAEMRNNSDEAKNFYENAIALNPSHVKSLQKLAMILHARGNSRLAEKTLRDAVNADPTSPATWKNLGTVLTVLGENDSAIECLLTAVNLHNTTPIMPFSTVQRTMLA